MPQLPTTLGKVLVSHIDTILEKGYAKSISSNDFFHGHVLWKPGKRLDPELLKGSLDSVAGILYHTAEHNGRWESEKALPYDQRTPRSIFGTLDGNITPVKDFLDIDKLNRTRVYHRKGTVYEIEFSHQKEGFAAISWPDELDITAASQFNFGLLSDGRFRCAAGRIDAQFSTQWQGQTP